MFMDRLTWPEVKDHLDREYESHGGYLPHHAEDEWAPTLGITPGSVRKKFNAGVKTVCERSWNYRLSPCDIEVIGHVNHAFLAWERMQSAGRAVPPFPAFAQAFHSARLFDFNATMTEITRRCPKCSPRRVPGFEMAPLRLSRQLGAVQRGDALADQSLRRRRDGGDRRCRSH